MEIRNSSTKKTKGRLKCYLFTFCKTQPGSDKQMDSFWLEILHKILKLSIEGGKCSYKQLMFCFLSHQNDFQT